MNGKQSSSGVFMTMAVGVSIAVVLAATVASLQTPIESTAPAADEPSRDFVAAACPGAAYHGVVLVAPRPKPRDKARIQGFSPLWSC